MNKALEEIRKEEAKFDMTPMIDVTFLLIIFFMIASQIKKIEYEDLVLPIASQSVPPPKNIMTTLVVNVTMRYDRDRGEAVSSIKVGGRSHSEESLTERLKTEVTRLKTLGKSEDDLKVVIRADGRAEYIQVQRVLMACMNALITNISIGAAPTKKGGG